MGTLRKSTHQAKGDDGRAWRVLDDFPADVPVGAAELDAVEAFLMPLVNAIMSGMPCDAGLIADHTKPADSQEPQKSGTKGR